jgi:hypothetical protein
MESDVAVENPAKTPKRSPLTVVLAVAVAVGVIAAGALVIKALNNDGPTATSLLASAQSFTKEHQSARFTGRIVVHQTDSGEDSSLGSASTFTSKIEGSAQSTTRSRAVIDSGQEGTVETIVDDKVVYLREASAGEKVADRKFQRIDTTKDVPGVVNFDLEEATAFDVSRLLENAQFPKKVSHSDSESVISATVRPSKLLGAEAARDVDSITLRLTILDSGAIRTVRQVTKGSGTTVTTTLEFTGWGDDVAIALPNDNQIDPTPGIEEERIAAWKDAPLYKPRAIPAGWVFDGADVLPEEVTTEGCKQVELDYEDPTDPDNGYISLYEFPVSCAEPFNGEGVVPFTAGPYAGFAQADEEGALVQITVGKTTLQAETDLPLDALKQVLANLVPLNLKAKPGSIPGIGTVTSPA